VKQINFFIVRNTSLKRLTLYFVIVHYDDYKIREQKTYIIEKMVLYVQRS